MLRKFFTYVILILTFISNTLGEVLAYDESSLQSLEDLSYEASETFDSRRALLEGVDMLDASSREDALDTSLVLSQGSDTPHVPIIFDADTTSSHSFMTLLAEKRIFEKNQEILVPTFLTNPFVSDFSKDATLLDLFLSSGSLENREILMEISPLNEQESSLSPKIARVIVVGKKALQKKRIPGMRGAITYEIKPGTIITSARGDMIDTSKISMEKLDMVKKQQAKKKYEKKMKNRGTLKKGLAIAQVEGFEFGIPGTHLLFSKPVTFTIDTPNMGEGMVVDLLTMHTGDRDFQTGGLSVSSETLCDTYGFASIAGSQAIVKNGKITFYTCGASSFTMNPTGGTAGSNDLRIIVGDCAQAQIYYNNLTQIYQGNPAATGCGLPAVWVALRIGMTTYGNGVDGVIATPWSTQTTTGSTNGNTYTARSTMTQVVGALTYTLIIDWSHTAPNKYITWSYRLNVPATNAANIRLYLANDSAVAGADTNDSGYYTATGGETVGVYDNVANVLSAFRYLSGALWTGYQAGLNATVSNAITTGMDYPNTIIGTGDLAFGVDWNFGVGANITYSGALEWRMVPYVAGNVPDLVPGIGQPEGPLAVGTLSQLPITVSNVGNASSSGVHTVIFTVPTNITGPSSTFVDNGWSCGAQVGTGVTCTKTTAITAPTGTDTLRIPVIPTLAASGTSVTFNVGITNPGDSNTANNTAFATGSVIGGAPSIDPGGIAGETLWLQANNNRTSCTINGCSLTGWANIGSLGNAANAVTGSGTVTFSTSALINGNPTAYFNNASMNTNSSLNVTTAAASVFAVTKIAAGGQFLFGPQGTTKHTIEWATTPTQDRWKLYNGTVFYSGANLRSVNIPAITASVRQTGGASVNYTNGLQTLSSATPTNVFASGSISIGRSAAILSNLANLAEVIIFPIALSAAQKNQVESYLAIKYGITINQTTPTNYTISNSSIAWDAALAGIYKNDITGIGRDDTSTLNQNISQSLTNTGDIIISKSAIATNRLTLIGAHDGGSISSFSGTDSPTGYQRMPRKWLLQEKNGDLSTVKISYPAGAIPPGFISPLILLTDSDGVFASGAVVHTGIYIAGTNTWDFSLNIADMDYIAFAKTEFSDTTSPTILTASVSSGTLAPIGTFPLTYTYSDTGSAINAASFTGKIYPWDSTGATWSVIDIASSYLSVTSASTSTGILQLTNLPFGKYRFDILISDTAGNTLTQSYTYFVDAVIWTVSAPLYPIGSAPLGSNTFGSGELVITIQTVGAGLDLSMIRTTDLTYITDIIPVYSGSTGWGYSQWNGTSFPSIITPHGTSQSLASVVKNININGQRNTFIYRIKYGVNPSSNTSAGDYSGMVRFGLDLTY